MPSTATPAYAVGVGEATAPRGDLNRLLGPEAGPAAVIQPAAASRFALSGVLSPKEGQGGTGGVALIAVDGRPARAYQVGARLVDNYVLQGVTRRTASLGPSQSAAAIVLELPERPAPATGTLPSVDGVEPQMPATSPAMAAPPAQMQMPQAQQGQPQMQFQPPPQYAPPPNQAPELAPQQPTSLPEGVSGDGNAGPQMGQGPPRRGMEGSR